MTLEPGGLTSSATATRVLTGASTGAILRAGCHRAVRHHTGDAEEAETMSMSHKERSVGVPTDVVAIVTGGSAGTGRELARAVTRWGWAIVVVYLEHQHTADATVKEILAADGDVVTVRADLTDDLDVQRLFAESNAAFAGVDVLVHTAPGSASLLYLHAARHIRARGAIVSTLAADRVPPGIALQLRDRGISVGRALPEDVLSFLDRWRKKRLARAQQL